LTVRRFGGETDARGAVAWLRSGSVDELLQRGPGTD
jgi:hypothetical protein